MNIKILGIEIERKTDILAFVAFLISISSLVTQTANLIKGPEVNLEPPTQILINSHKYPDDKSYIRISAKLTYLNTGSPGYDDNIKSEKVSFSIQNREITLIGQEYIESSVENKTLKIERKSDAVPVQIKSGTVVSHETYFAPWPSNIDDAASNFQEFSDFLKQIKTKEELNIKITSTTFGGKTITANCRLMTNDFIKHLETKSWSAPICR